MYGELIGPGGQGTYYCCFAEWIVCQNHLLNGYLYPQISVALSIGQRTFVWRAAVVAETVAVSNVENK